MWGVLHNGVSAFEGAHKALKAFREEAGGKVVLITNAPRPAKQVGEMLAALGVPVGTYDDIVTSGDVTREILVAQGKRRSCTSVRTGTSRCITALKPPSPPMTRKRKASAAPGWKTTRSKRLTITATGCRSWPNAACR